MGYSDISFIYIGWTDFWGVKIFNFTIFGGFSTNITILGIFVDIFGGHF